MYDEAQQREIMLDGIDASVPSDVAMRTGRLTTPASSWVLWHATLS